MANAVERVQECAPATLNKRWDPRATSCDSQVKAAIGAAGNGRKRVSTGLFALWVGWPGGLALYVCGRAARVTRRDA